MPPDHEHVFRNITRYAVVDRDKVYERLGYYGPYPEGGKGFLVPYDEVPMQLCTPSEFRDKICGDSPDYSSIIEVNRNAYGIPQGAPISDLLANAYLIDFDSRMAKYARERGGYYYRYSDDILIVIPGGQIEGKAARKYAMALIGQFGENLHIKPEKSSVIQFMKEDDGQAYRYVDGAQGRHGLEYLGFRFDGTRVYLRDSTLSAFYRKITYSARRAANAFIARYPGKDIFYLVEHFDYDAFTMKFGRVEDFENNPNYRTWTFWTYAKRAAEIFGPQGKPIHRQLRNHRNFIRQRIRAEMERALVRVEKKSAT